MLSPHSTLAAASLCAIAVAGVLGLVGLRWASFGSGRQAPRLLTAAAFVWATGIAGILAWRDAILGRRRAVWEPTRRPG
jgi:hypothetical protein